VRAFVLVRAVLLVVLATSIFCICIVFSPVSVSNIRALGSRTCAAAQAKGALYERIAENEDFCSYSDLHEMAVGDPDDFESDLASLFAGEPGASEAFGVPIAKNKKSGMRARRDGVWDGG
jgi:hypothetical protein